MLCATGGDGAIDMGRRTAGQRGRRWRGGAYVHKSRRRFDQDGELLARIKSGDVVLTRYRLNPYP
jgi:hypothetical protein